MAEKVEKLPEEQKAEAEAEAQPFLVVCDVPEAEEETANPQKADEQESLLVPEAEVVDTINGALIPNSSSNEPLTKTEDHKEPQFAADHHLPENYKKPLQELKALVQESLTKQEFCFSEEKVPEQQHKTPPKSDLENEKDNHNIPVQTIAKTLMEDDGAKTVEAIEETIIACVHPGSKSNPTAENAPKSSDVFIWGVKLMEDAKTDVILLKFLRARDFKVKEAFTMLKNTLKWRKEFGIDNLVENEEFPDFGSDLERAVFMHGCDREGHPICYNVYGEFQNKELYQKAFSDEGKRQRFLRWRIQFLEKSIRKLDFNPGGVSTIVQINDLRNSPGPNRWELRQATNQALHLLQDNYPEFVAKQVFINVPWWYLALSKMISPFLTQRTKSKFVVAGPSTSTETLLKYISGEQIPAEYGGLSKDGEFGADDNVTEIIVKPSAKHIVEFPVNQECVVSWEFRVVGWEVSYGAEFVPSAEDGYTIIIQKMKRIGSNEDQYISSNYRASEPGKLIVTINNLTSKKKKLLSRFKTNLSSN